jgi:hypothetical protein
MKLKILLSRLGNLSKLDSTIHLNGGSMKLWVCALFFIPLHRDPSPKPVIVNVSRNRNETGWQKAQQGVFRRSGAHRRPQENYRQKHYDASHKKHFTATP